MQQFHRYHQATDKIVYPFNVEWEDASELTIDIPNISSAQAIVANPIVIDEQATAENDGISVFRLTYSIHDKASFFEHIL